MKDYKLYIFDWDGTLMDSISRIVASMQSAANDLNLSIPSDEDTKSIIGLSLPIAVSSLFPNENLKTHNDIVQQYKVQFQEVNTTPMPLFEHADILLSNLKQQNKLLAVATGKGRNGLERVWQLTDSKHYFHASRCADETQSKPHPDMLHQLLIELDIEPHEAVMIGDTRFDLEMAQNAGIDSIAVTMGVGNEDELSMYNPKVIVNSLFELTHLVS